MTFSPPAPWLYAATRLRQSVPPARLPAVFAVAQEPIARTRTATPVPDWPVGADRRQRGHGGSGYARSERHEEREGWADAEPESAAAQKQRRSQSGWERQATASRRQPSEDNLPALAETRGRPAAAAVPTRRPRDHRQPRTASRAVLEGPTPARTTSAPGTSWCGHARMPPVPAGSRRSAINGAKNPRRQIAREVADTMPLLNASATLARPAIPPVHTEYQRAR